MDVARIGATGVAHLLHQDWTQNSNDTLVSGPLLWVYTPFPEPRELTQCTLGHRQRSARGSRAEMTGAEGRAEESLWGQKRDGARS